MVEIQKTTGPFVDSGALNFDPYPLLQNGITTSTIAAIQQQPGRTCLKHEDITNIHQ
jgi:hypothetical protein